MTLFSFFTHGLIMLGYVFTHGFYKCSPHKSSLCSFMTLYEQIFGVAARCARRRGLDSRAGIKSPSACSAPGLQKRIPACICEVCVAPLLYSSVPTSRFTHPFQHGWDSTRRVFTTSATRGQWRFYLGNASSCG